MKAPLAASKLSAGLLILVTVWAFWNLQNAGPEGTLKRFFELAGKGSWSDVDRLLLPSEEQLEGLSQPEQFVVREAARIGSLGNYRLAPYRTGSRAAVIIAQVEDPSYGLVTTTWVLTRPSLRWTVDLKATVMAQARIGPKIAPEPPSLHSGLMDRF